MKGNTEKSKQTRATIYESAIALFQKNGFEKTTMRMIAKETGVSLGLAYYHFRSKEEIVMDFYKHTHDQAENDCLAFFEKEKDLRERLHFVLKYKLEQFGPYSNFLYVLGKTAGDPNHTLSPFSKETTEIRDKAIKIISKALEDSNERIPEDLLDSLPGILWFYQMGLIYYWLADKSESKVNTFHLIELSLNLIIRLLKLSKLPFMKSVRKKVIDIYSFIVPFQNPESSVL
jgi:AcrR family transcriptional regulator